MKADLVIHNASQLVTCASGGKAKKGADMSDAGIIEDGAVAILDGRITAVGESSDILERFDFERELDAGGKAVTPAFVECHTHIVYAGNRINEFELKIRGADYLEILEAGGGIISTVSKTRKASLADLIEQTEKRLDKMLALGVGTCEVKTGYGLDTATELKMLEVISELDQIHLIDLIPTFLPAHAIPVADFGTENEDLSKEEIADLYIEKICDEMLPAAIEWYKTSHFHEKYTCHLSPFTYHFFIDVFCEKSAFDLTQSKKVIERAKELGFMIKAHVDEFTNLGCAGFAIEQGATSIDHLDATSDEEIAMLAGSETVGIVTPTVNFNFGSTEFADARKMIDSGCAIAVSTDYNPGSAPCPSLPNAMAIACRYQKLLPAEAFNGVTVNAAFAVGLGKETGSVEIGKKADILILQTDDYRELCYEFGDNLIKTVIKNGEIVERYF